jgi:hypothetical protein
MDQVEKMKDHIGTLEARVAVKHEDIDEFA